MNKSPKISVIIPVFNEVAKIQQCLQSLAQVAETVPYEVIVVDGDAQGSTISGLSTLQYHNVLSFTAKLGRGIQMNAGARKAQGEILLFLHADTQLQPQALEMICAVLENPDYVGGAFDLNIDSAKWSLKTISKVASLRSRMTRIPYGDQAIFLRQAYFHKIGGYPEIPIMEDVALMQKIKRCRGKIYIFCQAVRVSPRRWENEGVLCCTLRNWLLLTCYYAGVDPHQLAAWYRPLSPRYSSHK
jgi:rSAM/selenodomain-associated transferase 2